MTRDCGHSTGDDQRLRTQYRRFIPSVSYGAKYTVNAGHLVGSDLCTM
ncbi:unnamed protein product [Staurois parvus]|uniref:Uncharacterized protein n=1 Tax=Staurois parvus TaxID=386267 RepID=A0ABN9DPB1_9NEOB|nr:unnamed protein product [Staurois parvus]